MLPAHRDALLNRLSPAMLVLDVGGWASPLPRADWVIDLMPFETRGLYDRVPGPERFSSETWLQRDICDREPWPFADDHFDFVVCSHTLEDLRDPVWVCQEIVRVGRAGYVEVPSRLEEQSWGFEGPWTGWSHHRWLCDIAREQSQIAFTFKYHLVHSPELCFPAGFAERLTAEQRVDWLWWEGSFGAAERIHMDPAALVADLQGFVTANRDVVPRAPVVPTVRHAARAIRHRLRAPGARGDSDA
jgi:hypothetical protein